MIIFYAKNYISNMPYLLGIGNNVNICLNFEHKNKVHVESQNKDQIVLTIIKRRGIVENVVLK